MYKFVIYKTNKYNYIVQISTPPLWYSMSMSVIVREHMFVVLFYILTKKKD
jgi:hypothetical protein